MSKRLAFAATLLVTMLGAGAASAEPTVQVHIDSPVKATLERTGGGPVCSAPCDVEVPIDGTYQMRIAGEVETSLPFELRALPGWGRLTLKVDPSSRRARRAGTTVIVVGAVGVVAGAAVAATAGSASSLGGGVGALLLGGALAGVGVISVLIGVVMRAAHSEEQTVTQTLATAAHGVRTAWREPEATNRSMPQPLALPSLRFSF